MKKVILWCFAGRKLYMEIQLKYVTRLLEKYDFIERYDIWDMCRTPEDREYLKTLDDLHEKIRICHTPIKEYASWDDDICHNHFAYLYKNAYPTEKYYDYIFVKLDDDITYLDVDNFDKFIEIRSKDESSFLVSANVVNNLHMDYHGMYRNHDNFLKNFEENKNKKIDETNNEIFQRYRRLSINFSSYLGSDLHHIEREFSNGIGKNDEWRLCYIIPKILNRQNLIVSDYYVSHFSFNSQLRISDSEENKTLLERYWNLLKNN